MSDTTYIPIGQAARMLGVSVETLRVWESAGKVSAIRTPRNQRRFDQAEILALLDGAA